MRWRDAFSTVGAEARATYPCDPALRAVALPERRITTDGRNPIHASAG